MLTVAQARTIERLRAAAKEHSEVHDLLCMLAEAFPFLDDGDSTFHGDADAKAYLAAAVAASVFLAVVEEE